MTDMKPEMKKQHAQRSSIWRLIPYLRPQLGLLLISLVLVIIVNAAELAQPFIVQIIIDKYLKLGQMAETLQPIITLSLFYLGSVMIASILQIVQSYLMAKMGQNTLMEIRRQVFRHILHMPMRILDRYSSGRLITRATNDVETLNELFADVIVNLFRDIFLLIGIATMMLILNWQMALIAFVTTPLIALVTVLIRTKLRRNFIVMKQLIGQINGFFAENIAGMRLVQIFNREAAKHREFDQLNTDYCDKTLVQIRLNSLMRPLMEVINNLGIVLLIWFGLRGMTGGTLQIGVLYAFTAYIRRFFEPINDLAEKYSSIQSAAVSADRIFELLDKRDDLEDLQAGDPMPPLQGRVEFRNVWFAYEEEQWVLRDVSFVMNPGESAAIVGATGAGKSTIISLMLRFYDIQKGSILLDGRDIREFKIVELRRQVAIVLQDVFLFSGSIAENIRLGDEQIDDEQVAEALKLSYADEFINRLSKQMATHVTERGSTFSAGQRQLLSFARAIARRPSIFILDEATANIDTETEQLIQQSIAQVTARCTTIIIAHRLSTIRHSDQILVMADGRLVEIGDHDTLLRHNGRYAELYRAQFAD
ncbi:MAG: ABC transporter ATP-binding protein [Eubacteriales bacterium]|nr:ABC transporter ATP-binding protein [Eubacteriales bacterium]MDD3866226.1 ABC transporter ATP-binding protein [Eubacteriales bacterium]